MKVNNDTPVEVAGSDEPGIKTNEIETKLLVRCIFIPIRKYLYLLQSKNFDGHHPEALIQRLPCRPLKFILSSFLTPKP